MIKVLTFGVFDYFHLGHLRLFKQCKNYGDYLIVGVQNEKFILKYKPNSKIVYSTEERKEMLESIKIVDKVIVYDEINLSFIENIDFDILALGEDHVGERFDILKKWCKENGKKIVRLKRTSGICSTKIKQDLEDYNK